jgi:hypothetical protein
LVDAFNGFIDRSTGFKMISTLEFRA